MGVEMSSNMAKPLVLVVEDEAALATMLRYNLEKQGFRVDEAGDGQEALIRIAETSPDLVLLDWMLPVISGIEVCRQIRRRPASRDLPIIMVTARTEDGDAVRGLNTGADDYITKPFNMDALLARMRALLRRAGGVPAKGRLEFHDIGMDLATHRVQRNGRSIHLGPTEFRLAGVLHAASAPGVLAGRAVGCGLGTGHPCGAADGGCAYPSPPQIHQCRRGIGHRPDGARRRVCLGYGAGLASSASAGGTSS